MSGGSERDAATSAPSRPDHARPVDRPSVFDTPVPPTLPPSATPTAVPGEFDRHAAPTPNGRAQPAARQYYRTEQERAKSVYRRANPWYRRLGRGVVAACILVVFGGALYVGARALEGYLGRDRLPGVGAEVPDFTTSSFLITSGAPGPTLAGTLEVDEASGAFTFTGSPTGPQAGTTVASDGDGAAFVSVDGAGFAAAALDDPLVAALRGAIPYLTGIDGTDDLLTDRVRPFVTLQEQTTEGVGDGRLERYEMLIDTAGFSESNPLLWASFEQEAIPGVGEAAGVPVTIWVDRENVLVRLRASSANWSWERIEYGSESLDQQVAALVGPTASGDGG